MDLWKILVMGAIRLNCNWDYDKLQEIVNNHRTIRQMLGHGLMDDDYNYPIQTLAEQFIAKAILPLIPAIRILFVWPQ